MTSGMVSFLVPDVANPVIGPVTVLAQTLQRHRPVEIVGPDFGHGICPMYQDAFPYKVVPCPRMYRFPNYFWESRALGRALEGEIIVAVKAHGSTIPVALREKRRRGAKVVAYLDEWDGSLLKMRSARERLHHIRRHWHHPLEDLYFPMVEKLISRCDEVTSTSTFLQRKFGGRVLHMGVDTDSFAPRPDAEVQAFREQFELAPGKRFIVFGGVVRPHKGIETILDALCSLNDPTVALLVVGPISDHLQYLQDQPNYAPFLVCVGSQPKKDMPTFLSLADLIVLPLADTLLAQSQVPCKVFEAMAMGRPIVASAVSDLPLLLNGCGKVVPPGSATALAAAIREVLADPDQARAMGARARQRCVERYSRDQVEKELVSLMNELEVRDPS